VFGAARLLEAVQSFSHRALDGVIRSVMSEVRDWRGDADFKTMCRSLLSRCRKARAPGAWRSMAPEECCEVRTEPLAIDAYQCYLAALLPDV
jgi:hypothetical protein